MPVDRTALVGALLDAGFVAAEEEVAELVDACGSDSGRVTRLVRRRLSGEPMAWLTGHLVFAGVRIVIRPGVFVPRPQTEAMVRRAVDLLPAEGTAVDLCTGSGAIPAVLRHERPLARVVATDIDPNCCACAAANGVDVYAGHLADPLPDDLRGRVDVMTAVVPYVPTDELDYLPRDVRAHEPSLALDGGPGGLRLLVETVRASVAWLAPAGTLLVELGGDQDRALGPVLDDAGFGERRTMRDDDGDLRALEARMRRHDEAGVRTASACDRTRGEGDPTCC